MIPSSGYELRRDYDAYDARRKFTLKVEIEQPDYDCHAGEVLKGKLKPVNCPHFGESCTPEHPMGAPMVSSEGACAAYFHYGATQKTEAL